LAREVLPVVPEVDMKTTAAAHRLPRVLIAEDDDEMRSLVADTMRRDGYEVRAVSDGGHLLGQLAFGGEVDLLISDIRMPMLSGTTVLGSVRSALSTLPVILMTAFSDDATRAHAERLGAVLLDKPFLIDDLRAAVHQLLPQA
jgi:DNA-binding response OmpR family regulator